MKMGYELNSGNVLMHESSCFQVHASWCQRGVRIKDKMHSYAWHAMLIQSPPFAEAVKEARVVASAALLEDTH